MYMVVTENTNKIILYAQEEAGRLMSGSVEPAHLLLAIIRLGEGSAYELLRQSGFSTEQAKAAIEESVRGIEQKENLSLSAGTERVFRIAEGISREYHTEAVCSAHLLLAILRERINKAAAYLEREWHITYAKIIELYGEPHESIVYPQNEAEQANTVDSANWQAQDEPRKGKKGKTTALDKYGRDLTKQAEAGKLDPVVGRENEIERVIQILSRRKKNNPILIGEPGVGKSAIVEGLATRIVSAESGAL